LVVVTIQKEYLTSGDFTGTYLFGSGIPLPISGRIQALPFAHLPGVPHTFSFSFSTPPNSVSAVSVYFSGRLVLQTPSPYDAYIYGVLYVERNDLHTTMIKYVSGLDWIIW
jgi:hypothetical protein